MNYPPLRMRALPCAIVLSLTMAAVAGCVVSPASPDSGGPLSREEFLKQGNAICAAGNAEIEAAAGKLGGPPAGPAGEAFFQTIVTVSKRQINDVAALKPPADMKAEMDSIVADSLATLADMEAKGSDALFATEADPFAKINPRLKAIGLADCAPDSEG
ncbi:MAG: hypothetical protein ABI780_03410 [Ardenticatenales bacterium]